MSTYDGTYDCTWGDDAACVNLLGSGACCFYAKLTDASTYASSYDSYSRPKGWPMDTNGNENAFCLVDRLDSYNTGPGNSFKEYWAEMYYEGYCTTGNAPVGKYIVEEPVIAADTAFDTTDWDRWMSGAVKQATIAISAMSALVLTNSF